MALHSKWENGNLVFYDGTTYLLTVPRATQTVANITQLASLVRPSPLWAYEFFDDFMRYSTDWWTVSTTEAGSGNASEAIDNVIGGVLKLTNDDADDDMDQIQLVGEPFKLAANKPLWFETRLKVSDATESDFIAGLCITDTSLIAAMSDGVYFRKDDGDANIDFVTEKDGTATEADTGSDAGDDTYVRLGFYCDGVTSVTPYIDGAAATAHTTNIPDDEELTVSFAIRNGEAAAKSMSIDWVRVVQVR